MPTKTEFELRKISESVFDKSTLMTLYKLAKDKKLDEMVGIVSTGKESNVYHGWLGDREIAIKIYAVEASEFKNMDRYIRGDRRFPAWKNRRHLIYMWAKKEFKNLMRVYRKVSCPEPLAVEKNVLVMSFIGKDGIPAPKLKNLPPEKPKEFFDEILGFVKTMYANGFVHGDLSEYNILNAGKPVLIDFSQGLLKDHPYADELLQRDIRNLCNYFLRFGIKAGEGEILRGIKAGEGEILRGIKAE